MHNGKGASVGRALFGFLPGQKKARPLDGEAEGEGDSDRGRHDLRHRSEERFEPAQQAFGMVGFDVVATDLREGAAIERVGEQSRAIGREADSRTARCTPAAGVGQIIGHAGDDVAFFAAEIGLQFDDRGAPGDIDAAAVVDEIALMFKFAERRSKTLAQQLGDQAAKRLVAGSRGHRPDYLGQAVAPPNIGHSSPRFESAVVAVAATRA